MTVPTLVAYLSMEMGIEPSIPTYAGGLGALAGDTIRSGADLEIPMVGVTLLHRRGYFYQRLDSAGRQTEEPVLWPIDDFLEPLDERVTIDIAGLTVAIRAWQYVVTGASGFSVPVYLLDTDVEENQPEDRRLTDVLYSEGVSYRLCREVVLGYGGLKMPRALGYRDVPCYHLNVGHAALLILTLLEEKLAARGGAGPVFAEMVEAVRAQCVFTTHTPVSASHDSFRQTSPVGCSPSAVADGLRPAGPVRR
jgi:starch phosphorylase